MNGFAVRLENLITDGRLSRVAEFFIPGAEKRSAVSAETRRAFERMKGKRQTLEVR